MELLEDDIEGDICHRYGHCGRNHLWCSTLDSVVAWFGFSLDTTEDVKHINANQHHLEQMAHQVAMTIKLEVHDLEEREGITEDFLHLMVGVREVSAPFQIEGALVNGKIHGQTLQLNSSVALLGWSERLGATAHQFELAVNVVSQSVT